MNRFIQFFLQISISFFNFNTLNFYLIERWLNYYYLPIKHGGLFSIIIWFLSTISTYAQGLSILVSLYSSEQNIKKLSFFFILFSFVIFTWDNKWFGKWNTYSKHLTTDILKFQTIIFISFINQSPNLFYLWTNFFPLFWVEVWDRYNHKHFILFVKSKSIVIYWISFESNTILQLFTFRSTQWMIIFLLIIPASHFLSQIHN